MTAFGRLKYKTRIGILLATLLFLLLLNNALSQESHTQVEKTAKAIYEDRLMPSVFLFRIADALYKHHYNSGINLVQSRDSSTSVQQLIALYERTEFTKEEKQEWATFRQYLRDYTSNVEPSSKLEAFQNTIESLGRLADIQAGEGQHLSKDFSSLLKAAKTRGYLEIAILIVIGTITLALIGYSKNAFDNKPPVSPSLN